MNKDELCYKAHNFFKYTDKGSYILFHYSNIKLVRLFGKFTTLTDIRVFNTRTREWHDIEDWEADELYPMFMDQELEADPSHVGNVTFHYAE